MDGLVESERDDGHAVEMRGDRRRRTCDRVVAVDVVDRVHGRLDRHDGEEHRQGRGDHAARTAPSESRRGQQSDHDDRPREARRFAGQEELARVAARRGRKLWRFERRALEGADVGVGRPRDHDARGQGEHCRDPKHGGHCSEETRRTQRRLPFRYTGRVYALGLAARWLHLASSVLLVGAAAMIVLAGRSDRATAQRWEQRVLASTWLWALLAFGSGLVVLGIQTALFEGRAEAAFDPRAIGRVLLETQAGRVWLVRAGRLAALAAFLSVRMSVERRADWRAARGQAVLLGVAALVPLAAAGHAAAVEPDTARAIALDGLHLLGAGFWVGGLLPLAQLL